MITVGAMYGFHHGPHAGVGGEGTVGDLLRLLTAYPSLLD